MNKEYIIDATDKVFGRLASEIAVILRGKHSPGFLPYKMPQITVRVKNIGKIKLTGKKTKQKVYIHHTGHPRGLRVRAYEQQLQKEPARALRFAVLGMLPKNRQRPKIINHLIIE
jgi:large subunit ribosomal protein L13